MTPLLPRFNRHQEAANDAAALTQRLLETGDTAPTEHHAGYATLPGEAIRLRGIPISMKGVTGTQPHTDPLRQATLIGVAHHDQPLQRWLDLRRIQRNAAA